MPSEAPREISHFYVMVHPFFTLGKYPQLLTRPRVRKSVRFLLGLWGRRVQKAARDPKAVMIWITPNNTYWNDSPHYSRVPEMIKIFNLFRKKYDKLMEFAQKELGPRLIPYTDSISFTQYDPDANIVGKLKKRGFTLPQDLSKIRGKSYGEYIDDCITHESNRVQVSLGLKPNNHWQDTRFSLSDPDNPYRGEVQGSKPATLGPKTRAQMQRFTQAYRKWQKRVGR